MNQEGSFAGLLKKQLKEKEKKKTHNQPLKSLS